MSSPKRKRTPRPLRWVRLTNDQLKGANFALRVLHTSPRIQGAALVLLKDLIKETYAEMGMRPALWGSKVERVRGAA